MKNESLLEQLREARALRDEVLKKTAPLEAKRDEAQKEVAAAQAKMRAIGEKIAELKDDKFREACNTVAALTAALGAAAIAIEAEPGGYGMKAGELGGEKPKAKRRRG